MDEYAGDGCEACAGISAGVRKIAAAGSRNVGGGWVPVGLTRDDAWSPASPAFAAAISQARQRLVDKNGKVIDRDPEIRQNMRIWLVRSGHGWLLDELQVVQ
jgi:hypothetical protein